MIVIEFGNAIFYAENIIYVTKVMEGHEHRIDVYINAGADYVTLSEHYEDSNEADLTMSSIMADMLSTQMGDIKRQQNRGK
jgi:hypothetical protein